MGRIRLETAQTRPITKQKVRHGVLARFIRDEDGSFVILGLFLFVAMLMLSGLAVDLMRYETHRTRLQSTLDRATLAAASMSQPLPPKQVVMDYMSKAGLGGLITEDDIIVQDLVTSRRVEVSADLAVSSTFLNFVGITELTAPGHAAAEESASQTEISLILDVSGSMGWDSASGNTKISELRTAAKQFVNLLLCEPSDPTETVNCSVEVGKVSISLVPYAEQVLAGETLLSSLNDIAENITVTAEHTDSSCIHWYAEDFERVSLDLADPALILQRAGHFDPWRDKWSRPRNRTCKTHSWRKIMPLEISHAALRNKIDQLRAGGYTSIDVGMKWGSLLLDPSFRPATLNLITSGVVDSRFSNRPFSYSEPGIRKVVVLMTDGENTTQNYLYDDKRDGGSEVWFDDDDGVYSVYHPVYDVYYDTSTGQFESAPYGGSDARQLSFQELWKDHWTRKRYDNYSWLDAGHKYGTATKDDRLDDICTAAKNAGIRVYTVGFETSERSNEVLADCATGPANHFDVAGTDLTSAFATIAREINKLRLVD